MEETKYQTNVNYQNPAFAKGSVLTVAQWVAKGGTEDGFMKHVDRGYIVEWAGQANPLTQTVDSADTVIVEPSADPKGEESGKEVVDGKIDEAVKKDVPTGIWDWNEEDLEPLELAALNTLYKDTAAEYGIEVEYIDDKDQLIALMTSENGD